VHCHWAAGIKVVAIVLGIIFLSFSLLLSESLTFLPEIIESENLIETIALFSI
jgi:hypothetical protein